MIYTNYVNRELIISAEIIQSSVPELSGICFDKHKSTLYGVSDSVNLSNAEESFSGVYKIDPITGQTLLLTSIYADLEGITLDPNSEDLYVCTEDYIEEHDGNIEHISWDYTKDHFIVKLSKNDGYKPSIYGQIPIQKQEINKSLEGIAYYNTVNNIPQFLIGNLKKPIQLVLWNNLDGIVASLDIKKDDGNETEIADLYYNEEGLWILDSKTAKVFNYSISIVGNSILRTLKNTYDFSSIIDMDSTINDGDGENPEALCVTNSYIYVGCDYNSKIYKIARNKVYSNQASSEKVINSAYFMDIPLTKIYAGIKLIWNKVTDTIFGCFGSGKWNNSLNWVDSETWLN